MKNGLIAYKFVIVQYAISHFLKENIGLPKETNQIKFPLGNSDNLVACKNTLLYLGENFFVITN